MNIDCRYSDPDAPFRNCVILENNAGAPRECLASESVAACTVSGHSEKGRSDGALP
jgi:hypothetical protein